MTTISHDRCKNMILGALVADAAAMGLHWIYDQDHIRSIAPDAPEFTPPNPKNYDGVLAFFAHPNRASGAFSQYGEQAMVMLRTLAASAGQYSRAEFADQFRQHFGYGGAYVGYIDHATRDTLNNMTRFEDAAFACAHSLPFEGDPKLPKSLATKALPLIARHSGDALADAFLDAVASDNQAVTAYANELITELSKLTPPTGAHDLQLPAIAKLPPLVALLAAQENMDSTQFNEAVSSAIRVTSDHPTAAAYGTVCAQMMLGALTHGTITGAIEAGQTAATPEASALLEEAIAMAQQDNTAATKHFGMACDLPFGVPSATHNIVTATSFSDAVKRNIYGGGDSCGRATLVGAVMGAVHGVGGEQGIPQDWIDRLEQKAALEHLLGKLFDLA